MASLRTTTYADLDAFRRQRRQYARRRRANLRQMVQEAKARPCHACGEQLEPQLMVFHHVRGVKLFNLGGGGVRPISKSKILAEIAKCDILCAPCHDALPDEEKETK